MIYRMGFLKNIFKFSKRNIEKFIVVEKEDSGDLKRSVYRVYSDSDADKEIENIINSIKSVDQTRFFHWFDLKSQQVFLSDVYSGDFSLKIYVSDSYEKRSKKGSPDILEVINEHIGSSKVS